MQSDTCYTLEYATLFDDNTAFGHRRDTPPPPPPAVLDNRFPHTDGAAVARAAHT
jgi:hypothetical protein